MTPAVGVYRVRRGRPACRVYPVGNVTLIIHGVEIAASRCRVEDTALVIARSVLLEGLYETCQRRPGPWLRNPASLHDIPQLVAESYAFGIDRLWWPFTAQDLVKHDVVVFNLEKGCFCGEHLHTCTR
jgi:hypothetical protein